MNQQETDQKNTVELSDAIDIATKLRASIGYLVSNTDDNQLACLLSLIEDSAEVLEGVLIAIHRLERQEESQAMEEAFDDLRTQDQPIAEDVPFD